VIAEWIPFLFLLCPVVLALVIGRIVIRRVFDGSPLRCERVLSCSPLGVSFDSLRWYNHDRISAFGGVHTPAGLVACIAEEHGEVAACILGLTGEKKRKGHLTIADLGHELADVVTYCDLLADQYGIDLGAAVREKFNIVSGRVGYGKVWE
jgi:NTP pyrophosphatase (non-canonical NTP hydrolase)